MPRRGHIHDLLRPRSLLLSWKLDAIDHLIQVGPLHLIYRFYADALIDEETDRVSSVFAGFFSIFFGLRGEVVASRGSLSLQRD